MSPRPHPTWSEIRAKYLSDPAVAKAAEELHQLLNESYAPLIRDRATERARCEATLPGYREEREALDAI